MSTLQMHAAAQQTCELCLRVISSERTGTVGATAPTLALHASAVLRIDTRRQFSNPYDSAQADLRVTWISPTSRRITTVGYFDPVAPAGWRVRFLPTEPGRWRAIIRLRGAGISPAAAISSVRVAARALASKPATGLVRAHRANPSMLQLSDGRPYFPIGANIAWYTHDAVAEYTRRFDALAANGGNAARVWLAPWSFAPEWRDTPLGDYGNRAARLAAFDAVLALAEVRGIRLIVVLLEPGMFNPSERWRENPYNAANGGPCATPADFLTEPRARAAFKNQVRYIAARWGQSPSILAWEWMNEVNSAPGFETERLAPWLVEMTAHLRAHDPARHLTTISYAAVDGDPRVWMMPEIDLVQRHEYASGDPKWFATTFDAGGAAIRFKQVRELAGKPLIVGEFGANSAIERPSGAYRQGIQLRNGLWASVFAGMAGSSMYWWWDNYLEDGGLWTAYRGLSAFLAAEDLARFAPARATAQADGFTRATAMALMRASPADGRVDRALVWVRNRAWSHDDALVRFALDRSSGQTTEETFVFEPRPAENVRLVLPDLPAGRYRINAFDTMSGAALAAVGPFAQGQTITADEGGLSLTLGALTRDVALRIESDIARP